LQGVRDIALFHVHRANTLIRKNRSHFENVLPLTKWALKLFREGRFVVWKNDKEPGWTLLTAD